MGNMRRGNPHTVEGSYDRVYQAQSILSAHMEGNSGRYQQWVEKYSNQPVPFPVSVPDTPNYICPDCNNVI
jgi:hypothetical protein